MTSHRLRTFAAAFAIGTAAIVAPSAPSQAASASSTTTTCVVAVADSAPTGHPITTPTAQAQVSVALSPARRRFSVRNRHHGPVSPIAVIIALVVGGIVILFALLFRYFYLGKGKAQSRDMPSFNSPNGPQYGVTGGPNYGPQYPQAGTPMGAPPNQGYSNHGGTSNHTPGIG